MGRAQPGSRSSGRRLPIHIAILVFDAKGNMPQLTEVLSLEVALLILDLQQGQDSLLVDLSAGVVRAHATAQPTMLADTG